MNAAPIGGIEVAGRPLPYGLVWCHWCQAWLPLEPRGIIHHEQTPHDWASLLMFHAISRDLVPAQ